MQVPTRQTPTRSPPMRVSSLLSFHYLKRDLVFASEHHRTGRPAATCQEPARCPSDQHAGKRRAVAGLDGLRQQRTRQHQAQRQAIGAHCTLEYAAMGNPDHHAVSGCQGQVAVDQEIPGLALEQFCDAPRRTSLSTAGAAARWLDGLYPDAVGCGVDDFGCLLQHVRPYFRVAELPVSMSAMFGTSPSVVTI